MVLFLALHNAGIASAFVHGNNVHCSPSGVPKQLEAEVFLRICPHIYNSTKDIDFAVEIAAKIQLPIEISGKS
jgi:selenocysteine lyase/cysteine desulfurase